jgi:GTP-binding protein
MLIDRATIFVRGGKGGGGCVSLRREKYVPKGGPDGGNGGHGGNVVLAGDQSLDTLLGFTYSPHFRAGNGRPGRGKSMRGADGDDRVVPVPLGTLVYEAPDGKLLGDVSRPGQKLTVARGGKGGLGNEHFKSPTNQTPRHATPGEVGEERMLRLELKLIADVGLVGKPNAGKSTMLRAMSKATPKVADYPFTTRSPNLGIAELDGDRRLVVADIPGLIEGAAGGAGLGHEFLRHIERTTVLVHLLEVVPDDGTDPADNYRAIRRELAEYSPALAEKTEIVAVNKIDLVPQDQRQDLIDRVAAALRLAGGERPRITSGATREGVTALLEACWLAAGSGDDEPGWGGACGPA